MSKEFIKLLEDKICEYEKRVDFYIYMNYDEDLSLMYAGRVDGLKWALERYKEVCNDLRRD